jgi:hypothetical protein
MKQLTEVAGVDCHPQLIQCEELRSNFLRRVRLRSLDGLNPTRKHMEAVGMSCRIGAETPACAPLASMDSGFLKQLSPLAASNGSSPASSLMIVVERFTVHGPICGDFFIPTPKP